MRRLDGLGLVLFCVLAGCGGDRGKLLGDWVRGPVVVSSTQLASQQPFVCGEGRETLQLNDDASYVRRVRADRTDGPECEGVEVPVEELERGTWLLAEGYGDDALLYFMVDTARVTIDDGFEAVEYRDDSTFEYDEAFAFGRDDGDRWLWLDRTGRFKESK